MTLLTFVCATFRVWGWACVWWQTKTLNSVRFSKHNTSKYCNCHHKQKSCHFSRMGWARVGRGLGARKLDKRKLRNKTVSGNRPRGGPRAARELHPSLAPGSFKRDPGPFKRHPGSFKRVPGSFKRALGPFKRTLGSRPRGCPRAARELPPSLAQSCRVCMSRGRGG